MAGRLLTWLGGWRELEVLIPIFEKIYFQENLFSPVNGSSTRNCLAHHDQQQQRPAGFSLETDQSHYNGEKNRLEVKWRDPTSALRLALS